MNATLNVPNASADGFGPAPPARRARNLAGALLGALLVVVCAATVAIYTAKVAHRRGVLVVVRNVKAGAVITSADLGEAGISADPSVRSVPSSQRDRIVGRVADVNLVAGTLITRGELATGPTVDPSHAVVGLALKPGQLPGRLQTLDRVMLVDIATSPDTTPSGNVGPGGAATPDVLVQDAEVSAVEAAPDGQTTVVSVIVQASAAPVVAAAGARGQVSVVLRGGPQGG